MAASAWTLYNKAKRYIGNGTIQLGVYNFKMALFATASNAATVALSTYASLTSQVSATGKYVTGGLALPPATGQWTTGASTGQMKFTYTTVGLTVTASGASINNIRYAVIYQSGGKLLCYCALSSIQFTVASPNTLTILPAASGVFTLT